MLAASAGLALAIASAGASMGGTPCATVPLLEGGALLGERCLDEAVREGWVVVDLSDAWVPRALVDTAYAETWRALADGRIADAPQAGPRAASDAFFEPWGITPTLRLLRARLGDSRRHACHALVDDRALAALTADLAAGARAKDAVAALQGHLVCDGLLDVKDADTGFGGATARALAAWQRMEGLIGPFGALDAHARDRLLLSSEERDLQALLRALRERVVDAQALLEDGTAAGLQHEVVGRRLDPDRHRPPLRQRSGGGAAPDVIGATTDAAARALGFTSSAAARRALDALPWQGPVALPLPPAPVWHGAAMELSARIERGATTPSGLPLPRGPRPAFQLITVVDGEERPLVLWPTTVGGLQREKIGEAIVQKEKPSPTGVFAWRWLWVAPAWYPPPTTPDDELLLRTAHGVVVNEEGIGPGYRSAYGLVMLQHHQAGAQRPGSLSDTGVRTHGTGDVESVIVGAVSHGCHRLLPLHALRLGGFLLAHRAHGMAQEIDEGWSRDLRSGGKVLHVERKVRGTRIELTPPVSVFVLAECPGEG